MNKGFRLKTMDEIRNDVIEKLDQNEMISKKHKKGFFDFTSTYFSFQSY